MYFSLNMKRIILFSFCLRLLEKIRLLLTFQCMTNPHKGENVSCKRISRRTKGKYLKKILLQKINNLCNTRLFLMEMNEQSSFYDYHIFYLSFSDIQSYEKEFKNIFFSNPSNYFEFLVCKCKKIERLDGG